MVHLLGLTAITGLDADDGSLVDVVALGAGHRGNTSAGIGVEYREDEVTVTQAAPSPVDVEEVTVGIAVADEGVTAASTGTAVINQGTTLDKFLINHVFPVGLVIVAAVHQFGVIVEVVVECGGDVRVAGAGRIHAVIHVGGAAGIEHEPCHGILFGLSLGTGIVVTHVVPVKNDGTQRVSIDDVILLIIIIGHLIRGDGLSTSQRELIVVHDLSHGSGDAARIGIFADGVSVLVNFHELGAVVPVGSTLVPVAGNQRRYAVARGTWGVQVLVAYTQQVQCGDLLLVTFEPHLHVGRHVVGVKGAVVDVAQDGSRAVVTRDDDITLVAHGVENIVTRIT